MSNQTLEEIRDILACINRKLEVLVVSKIVEEKKKKEETHVKEEPVYFLIVEEPRDSFSYIYRNDLFLVISQNETHILAERIVSKFRYTDAYLRYNFSKNNFSAKFLSSEEVESFFKEVLG